jgi:hypothetical protein
MDWPNACLIRSLNTIHSQNRIEYLANINPTRIKKTGRYGRSNFFTDYGYLIGR